MRFEWNQNKDKAHRIKHNVSFGTASLDFDDPHHLSIQDRHEQGEERWQTLSMIDDVILLIVAYTVVHD